MAHHSSFLISPLVAVSPDVAAMRLPLLAKTLVDPIDHMV
jgi:hypothetical protein